MGRIKTTLVKSISRKLIKEHPEEFTAQFEKNKALVNSYVDVTSQKLRNVISGHTARLVKQKMILGKEPKKRANQEDLSRFYE